MIEIKLWDRVEKKLRKMFEIFSQDKEIQKNNIDFEYFINVVLDNLNYPKEAL